MIVSRRLMPDLIAIQAFECAARHASFTRAGRELNLTQSAVSRQVKDLETYLGALLFERIRQRIVLSQDERRFLRVAGGALLASGPKLTPADLLNESLLHLATRPRLWSQWLEWAGLPGETAYRGHRFDQFSMIIEAAVAGMGYALLPRYLIER